MGTKNLSNLDTTAKMGKYANVFNNLSQKHS